MTTTAPLDESLHSNFSHWQFSFLSCLGLSFMKKGARQLLSSALPFSPDSDSSSDKSKWL